MNILKWIRKMFFDDPSYVDPVISAIAEHEALVEKETLACMPNAKEKTEIKTITHPSPKEIKDFLNPVPDIEERIFERKPTNQKTSNPEDFKG